MRCGSAVLSHAEADAVEAWVVEVGFVRGVRLCSVEVEEGGDD